MEKQTKDNLKAFGFDKLVERVEKRLCPFCGMPVNMEDFRNDISRKEANLSGMCQRCQDNFFGKD